MGTITAQTLINRVTAAILNDSGKVRFLEAHLLAFLNEAQRFIASLQPEAYSAPRNLTLAAGAVQAVPADVNLIMKPRHNVVAGAPGRAITGVTEELLNTVDPNWRSGTQTATVKHIVFDPTIDKTTFLVYPPAVNGTVVSLVTNNTPADILIGATILLDDSYEAPIANYMLSRAYQKDGEYAGDPVRESSYMNMVKEQLGVKAQSDAANGVRK